MTYLGTFEPQPPYDGHKSSYGKTYAVKAM